MACHAFKLPDKYVGYLKKKWQLNVISSAHIACRSLYDVVPKWNSFRHAVVKFPISGGQLLMNTFLDVLATTNSKEGFAT